MHNDDNLGHGHKVFEASKRSKVEGQAAHMDKQIHERCPDIIYNNYLTLPSYFDHTVKLSNYALMGGVGKGIVSKLSSIYPKEEINGELTEPLISVTAINAERLIKRKFRANDAFELIVNSKRTPEILSEYLKKENPSPKEVRNFLKQDHENIDRNDIVRAFLDDAIRQFTIELNKLDIIAPSTDHKYFIKGRELPLSDSVFLCHNVVAKKEGEEVIKSEPRSLQHKLIAYFCVKGVIDDRDLDEHGMTKGIHLHPLNHWREEFEKEGIKPYEFIPQKQMALERF